MFSAHMKSAGARHPKHSRRNDAPPVSRICCMCSSAVRTSSTSKQSPPNVGCIGCTIMSRLAGRRGQHARWCRRRRAASAGREPGRGAADLKRRKRSYGPDDPCETDLERAAEGTAKMSDERSFLLFGEAPSAEPRTYDDGGVVYKSVNGSGCLCWTPVSGHPPDLAETGKPSGHMPRCPGPVGLVSEPPSARQRRQHAPEKADRVLTA